VLSFSRGEKKKGKKMLATRARSANGDRQRGKTKVPEEKKEDASRITLSSNQEKKGGRKRQEQAS